MQPDLDDVAYWKTVLKEIEPLPQASFLLPNCKILRSVLHKHSSFAAKQDFSTYSKALEDNDFGGIDKNTLRKFKREEFAVEAVLDLHGKNEDAAYAAVTDFVPRCYAQNKRCIIIITGKGLNVHADDDVFATKGVLKKLVPQWLNAPYLRAMIMLYKHPSARLGGTGAIYILLRRQR